MVTRRLIVTTPQGERELLFIGRLVVGRAPECDISLDDTKASRRHAEFDGASRVPRVVDLNSRNGILVNGKRVTTADLAPGDVVTIGDAQIRFEEQVDAPPPAAVPSGTDERTIVLGPPQPAESPATGADAPAPIAEDERTNVIGPPELAVREEASRTAPVSGAVPAANDEPRVVRDRAAAAPAPAVSADEARTPPDHTANSGTGRGRRAAASTAAPSSVVSEPAPPRFSWSGLVTMLSVLLGGLAVLLGALPLMSASTATIGALSQRQARTLAGWMAAGVDATASTVVEPRVLGAVMSQDGVERVMVLDRTTGRAVAPESVAGRSFDELPGIGAAWREVGDSPRVGLLDGYADAYASAGERHVVWVRYRAPSTSETAFAVIVALIVSLAFGALAGVLIKRQTRATLQQFIRQVELAVSGAPARVMRADLMPGLERLPGVITYLIEHRDVVAASAGGRGADGSGSARAASGSAEIVAEGPAWLEINTAMEITVTSPQRPAAAVSTWSHAGGRHVLDVLQDPTVRNAVVQGLGGLGMTPGAEATVRLSDDAAVRLARLASGHVRVTLPGR